MNILIELFPKDYIGESGTCRDCGSVCQNFCYNFDHIHPLFRQIEEMIGGCVVLMSNVRITMDNQKVK